MSAPAMKVEVGGKLRDLDDCSWYQIAPCGCACGVTLVSWPGGGEAVVTPESAHRHMTENAEVRRREVEAGFRMELGLRADVRERLGSCAHTPLYGVEKTPAPAGYEWAEAPGASSSKARKHLAPKDAVDAWRKDGAEALCGRSERTWRDSWGDLPECLRCAAKGKAGAA